LDHEFDGRRMRFVEERDEHFERLLGDYFVREEKSVSIPVCTNPQSKKSYLRTLYALIGPYRRTSQAVGEEVEDPAPEEGVARAAERAHECPREKRDAGGHGVEGRTESGELLGLGGRAGCGLQCGLEGVQGVDRRGGRAGGCIGRDDRPWREGARRRHCGTAKTQMYARRGPVWATLRARRRVRVCTGRARDRDFTPDGQDRELQARTRH
jgi:hypothetical protein